MFDNNNQQNQINVNTTFLSWYSDTCMLTIGAWNDKISLKFTPCTGKDSNGLNVYDKQKALSTGLNLDKASILYNKIKEKIYPLLKEDNTEEKSVSIQLGGKDNVNVLTVSKEKNADGNLQLSITFLKGVSGNGQANESTQILTYVFKEEELMVDYDSSTGTGITEKESGQFDVFCDILKNRTSILPMTTHASRYSKAISDKLSQKYNNGPSRPSDTSTEGFMSGGFAGMDELPFN